MRGLLPVLLGFALLYDRGDRGWRVVEELPTSWACQELRRARIMDETLQEIGGALANQAVDNPLRLQAYRRAEPEVAARYRCESRE